MCFHNLINRYKIHREEYTIVNAFSMMYQKMNSSDEECWFSLPACSVAIRPQGRCCRGFQAIWWRSWRGLLSSIASELSFLFVRPRHAAIASPCCVTFAFVSMPRCIPLFYSWRAFGLFLAVVRNTIAENTLLLDLKNIYLAKIVYSGHVVWWFDTLYNILGKCLLLNICVHSYYGMELPGQRAYIKL